MKFFKKIGKWFSDHRPSKRRLIQLYAALLFNANVKGYVNGRIYQGALKGFCTPGLNCYSCPGASGACPLGSLQNALSSANKSIPFYMFGIILLYGMIFGRWICGFLCPFGLIQDLLHKIKTPKIQKNKLTAILSKLKYVILVVFVFVLPLIYAFRDFPLPAFCKYICPAGTLGGAIGLLINPNNTDLFGMLGPLFTWKFALLVLFVLASIFIYRFFCRFFCPLGALYGLFNKISFIGVSVDGDKCNGCGLCYSKCKTDVRRIGDAECIQCGECISVCPQSAISRRGPKFMLDPGTPGGAPLSGDSEIDATIRKKTALKRRVLAIAMAVLLVFSLVYYNFIDKVPSGGGDVSGDGTTDEITDNSGDTVIVGSAVGNRCPSSDITLYGTSDLFSVEDTDGKVRVINFWGTWCGPCVAELPHFSKLAGEYSDSVIFVAIHSNYASGDAESFIAQNYPDSEILFGLDSSGESYYYSLGGAGSWPMTLVLDADGTVSARYVGAVSEETLRSAILEAMGE